jgi:hypothetical protein
MVNHTRYEHHYTVVIITWLIILGMDTLYSGYIYMVNHTRNESSMINHAIITTV